LPFVIAAGPRRKVGDARCSHKADPSWLSDLLRQKEIHAHDD
jgi:hypothetical protein